MCELFDGIIHKYGKSINFKRLNRTVGWRMEMSRKQREIAEPLAHFKHFLKYCPICKAAQIKSFATIYGYTYVECGRCEHIFLQTLPDYKSIEKLYSSQTDKERSLLEKVYIDKKLFKERVEMIANPKVDFIASIVTKKGLWIDIGCGVGEILKAAEERGWASIGYDIDQREIEFGNNMGLNIQQQFINDSNASEYLCNADIVTLFNLLEHINNPGEFLKLIVDAIKNNTYVAIEVPRHPSISSFSNLAFSHLAFRHIYPPDHLHIFTEKSIKHIFDDIGLKVLAIWYFGQDVYDLVMNAAANRGLGESSLLEKIIDSSSGIQKAVDESGLADTMLILTKKA